MNKYAEIIVNTLKKDIVIEEAYVFALYISENEPLAFNKKDSRFLPVTKVKIQNRVDSSRFSQELPTINFLNRIASFTKYNKSGTLSKTKIPYDKFNLTPIEIYFTEIEAIEAYEKRMVKAVEKIDNFKVDVLKEIDETRDKILYSR